MSFLIKANELSEKYNKTWGKKSAIASKSISQKTCIQLKTSKIQKNQHQFSQQNTKRMFPMDLPIGSFYKFYFQNI